MLAAAAHADGALTPTEQRWIAPGWPVVAYAKAQKLPLDIVVQPGPHPGDAPLAMGFVNGRCKLVLSMRGNPQAESALDGIAPELVSTVIEAMTAHEIGHCWRYVRGAWHTLPAGFGDVSGDRPGDDRELIVQRRDMREARREEGFADLVGLAWTLAQHPQQYDAVHAWFEQVRADQPVAGAHHDTRSWLRLVGDRNAFPIGATPFEQVRGLWREGLARVD